MLELASLHAWYRGDLGDEMTWILSYMLRTQMRWLVRTMGCIGVMLLAAGCATPRDQCVDASVCDSVMARFRLPDYVHRASRDFAYEGVEYHFIEIEMERGACCGGSDFVCAIWRSDMDASDLFMARITDYELAQWVLGPYCPPGSIGATTVCDWPGFESPVVWSHEFAEWTSLQGVGFMGFCRRALATAQMHGLVPTPEEIEASTP
jgi:hypothetical protein